MIDCTPADEFQKFLENELSPAVEELGNLEDGSRKHIQKLVLTNLVDRFDAMVANLMLSNCRHESLAEYALNQKDIKENVVTEADLVRILLKGDGVESDITERLKKGLRESILRERHAKKLEKLLCVFVPELSKSLGKPRVNRASGKILKSFKPGKNPSIPPSIIGYADWLYARRNILVHGGGSNKFGEDQRKLFRNTYKISISKSIKISVGSVKNAKNFYGDLVTEIAKEIQKA